MPELTEYIRCHIVEAEPMTRGEYATAHGRPTPQSEDPAEAGYRVVYPYGYEVWVQKTQFEVSSRPIDGMTFGQAIEAMKQGKKVARRGWNGKGMYLWLLPAASVKAEWCKEPHLKTLAEQNGGEVECLGSVRMKTADGKVLTGWLASQTDMLSEDWCIVE